MGQLCRSCSDDIQGNIVRSNIWNGGMWAGQIIYREFQLGWYKLRVWRYECDINHK